MTIGKEPDYTRYSLEQLERARRSIDVERFPERTKILDILIADRKARAAERAEATASADQPRDDRDGKGFFSHRNTISFKTPGQALLAAVGSAVMGIVCAAIMWASGMSEGEQRYFVLLWVLLSLFQTGQFTLEYRRLKQEALAATAPPPTTHRLPDTNNSPHRPPQSNQSPVQRL